MDVSFPHQQKNKAAPPAAARPAKKKKERVATGVASLPTPVPTSSSASLSPSSGPRLFEKLPPEVATRICTWLALQDLGRLQQTCSMRRVPVGGINWEYLYCSLGGGTQDTQRTGFFDIEERAALAKVRSWKYVEKRRRAERRVHDLKCMICRGDPIDGPLYSCLYCYGPHWVICGPCEKKSASWHPQEHILVRWPRSYSEGAKTLKGKFQYVMKTSLKWQAKPPHGSVECAKCHKIEDKYVVRCLTCPNHPVLCLPCGVGNRKNLTCNHRKTAREIRNCRQTLDTLLSIEKDNQSQTLLSGRPFKLYTGNGVSEHEGHQLIIYPPLHVLPVTDAPHIHRCICDVCDKAPPATQKRYRCALCFDYDRCESCQEKAEAAPKKKHLHPMVVLKSPAERDRIEFKGNAFALMPDGADEGDEETEEEDEEEEEEEEEEEGEDDATTESEEHEDTSTVTGAVNYISQLYL